MDFFTLTDIKLKNLSDVYSFIYQHPSCPKQMIANELGISLPTVSQHLNTLLDASLIKTCGRLDSTVGRRAVAYQVEALARIAIGIELLPHRATIVALNLYGKVIAREKISLDFAPTDDYFISLKNTVRNFMNTNHYKEDTVLGIGLGVQGLISPDGKSFTYGEILNSTGLRLDTFANAFRFPCKLIHDAECACYSELWEQRDLSDAIYISLGQHLGGAVLIDGKLQVGATGKSGTFEHMTLVPDGLTCYCGKKGCAECYCSGHALLGSDADDIHQELDNFFEKKAAGDTDCLTRLDHYLSDVAVLINNLHMVLETPVILGGHIASYFTDEDLDLIREKVAARSTFDSNVTYILSGKCKKDAVAIGAAVPYIQSFTEQFVAHLRQDI